MNEKYIVVSDVHLGGHSNNQPYQKELCEFLTWIKELPSNGNDVVYGNEKTLHIEPPTKIILLGDIIDIWDPKDQDRNNAIKDSVEPFSLLHDIGCEKIYVTGNHDEDIEEIATTIKNFEWKKGHNFIFCRRHFPEDENVLKGQEINGLHYSFLHGHQFDKEQITFKLSQILNTRFDPVDFAQDLANVSLTKRIPIYIAILFLCVFSFLFFFNTSGDIIVITGIHLSFKNFLGLIFGTSACYLAWKYYKSSKEFEKNMIEPPFFSRIFGMTFLVLLVTILTGLISSIVVPFYQNNLPDSLSMFESLISFLTTDHILLKLNEHEILILNFSQIFSFFYWIMLVIVSYMIIVSIIPRLITFFMRKFYLNVRKTRDEKIMNLLKDPGNYSTEKDKMDVNVVVFAHTHQADSYLCKQYLFTWDEISGDNNGEFQKNLRNILGIDWIKDAKIEKINDKTVRVYTEKNSLSLILNEKKTRVSLKGDDVRNCEIIAETKNDMLNIYKIKLFINTGGWVKEKDDRDVKTFAYINDDGIFLLKWDGIGKIDVLSHNNEIM